MVKKSFIILCLWGLVECFTSGWSNNKILSFPDPNERILNVTLYVIPTCPHALDIMLELENWIQSHGFQTWQTLTPTLYYPSPTLRIIYQDYGVNYIGKNDILAYISS